jgi:hypothetical protein
MTVREMIYDALRLVGVLNIGEGPATDEHTECLRALNTMIDAWNTERLTVYTTGRDVYSLDPPQASYTLGTGGDFDATRPVKIENAGIIVDGHEEPIALLDKDRYAAIRLKGLTTTRPCALYDDGGFPFRRLYLLPVPTETVQLALYAWRSLSAFADLDDSISLPPGYLDAIQYNLAVRLAPRYRGAVVSPLVFDQARISKGNIKRLNLPAPRLGMDAALLDVGGSQASYWDPQTGDLIR